ncbi:hypothetical protein [Streptomyces sp. NPDC048462]|uniref:hypothetical protein n=1 Tax=Streptomyces sp. NPDC048462 TaxID=3365555 RepID=UPI0037228D38
MIDEMLRADLDAPRKERHTVKRIFERLLDEHDADEISYQMVRGYVATRREEIRIEADRGVVEEKLSNPVDLVRAAGRQVVQNRVRSHRVVFACRMADELLTSASWRTRATAQIYEAGWPMPTAVSCCSASRRPA